MQRASFARSLIATASAGLLFLGAGTAQAQAPSPATFAAACSGQAPGTQVTIGPFYTGDTTQGASTWTVSPAGPVPMTSADYGSTWVNAATATPAQPAGANWIGQQFGTNNTTYTYTLSTPIAVDAAIIDPASIQVTGYYAADNDVSAVQVGANTLTRNLGTYRQLNVIAADMPTLGSLFQTGDNTIAFQVYNDNGITPNWTGLYANLSIGANCAQSTVPIANPAPMPVPLNQLALVVLALLMMGSGVAVRRRRHSARR